MKAAIAVAMALAASGDQSKVAPPTEVDFDIARTAHAHDATGLGGMAHCAPFDHFQCAPPASDPEEFHCTYREGSSGRTQRRKAAVLRRDGLDWRWLSGDRPMCSITVFN